MTYCRQAHPVHSAGARAFPTGHDSGSIWLAFVIAAEAIKQLQQATTMDNRLNHLQLGIRRLFEEVVVVVAWWKAK
jgi:hypothetical protein